MALPRPVATGLVFRLATLTALLQRLVVADVGSLETICPIVDTYVDDCEAWRSRRSPDNSTIHTNIHRLADLLRDLPSRLKALAENWCASFEVDNVKQIALANLEDSFVSALALKAGGAIDIIVRGRLAALRPLDSFTAEKPVASSSSVHDDVDPMHLLILGLASATALGVEKVALDVGAHHQTEFLGAVEADPTLLVIAFEPSPVSVAEHRRMVKHPRVILLPVAVASGPQRIVQLHMDDSFNGECNTIAPLDASRKLAAQNELIKKDVSWYLAEGKVSWSECVGTTTIAEVSTLALASVMALLPPHLEVSFLKIDAEGSDASVILSAGDSISRVHRVKLELQDLPVDHPLNLRATNFSKADIHEIITSKGFVLEHCSMPLPPLRYQDCVFVKPELRLDVMDDCFQHAVEIPEAMTDDHREYQEKLLMQWCCGEEVERVYLLYGKVFRFDRWPFLRHSCFNEVLTAERCCQTNYDRQQHESLTKRHKPSSS